MRKARTEEEDLKFLELLVHSEMKEVAQHFKISETAARSWLYRLRRKIVARQYFLNKVRTLQRMSPRVRKLTTVGTVPDINEGTGEEKWLIQGDD